MEEVVATRPAPLPVVIGPPGESALDEATDVAVALEVVPIEMAGALAVELVLEAAAAGASGAAMIAGAIEKPTTAARVMTTVHQAFPR